MMQYYEVVDPVTFAKIADGYTVPDGQHRIRVEDPDDRQGRCGSNQILHRSLESDSHLYSGSDQVLAIPKASKHRGYGLIPVRFRYRWFLRSMNK